MNKEQLEELREIFEPELENIGYELVDINWEREGDNELLVFYIYKDGGISIDDCERVDSYLNPRLDELDPVKGAYSLSVSSPDLNRPLKNDRDLDRNIGQFVEIRLYKNRDKKKDFIGKLLSYDQDSLLIEDKETDEEMTFERNEIALIKPAILF